jgi:predicted patatin/cPLA2 family phospholipase
MDEAGLRFDHIDATSGSVFNLAMLLSGRSATDIADAWGNLSPKEFVSLHPWYRYITFWKLPSLVTQEAIRNHILPKWGIDLEKVRSCTEVNGHPMVATFNICDFEAKRILTYENSQMDSVDRLLSVDAVPGVVPPVALDGTLYVDAMLLQDANVMEAVKRGADEIWIIWTVEEKSPWMNGFWNQFGHIFEICAVGNLYRDLDRIREINERVAAGKAEPGHRHITVHLIKPDTPIPVGYLFFRNRAQMQPVIEAGKEFARRYVASLDVTTAG